MRESHLLNHIYQRSAGLTAAFGHVVVGPGDDCAVIRSPSGDALLATTDQIISGRHFRPGTPVDRIARKLIARSVSDIAAMGGTPSWALVTGAMPSNYENAEQLFDAVARWGERFDCPLVGGDIASLDGASRSAGANGGPQVSIGGQKILPSFIGRMVLTCTIVGTPHPARGPVLRSAAEPGDEIWVTGRLGGSLYSGRHLAFTPRIREATWLCNYLGGDFHAMIDLSDGLGRDAGRLAAASGVTIELEESTLAMHEDVYHWREAVADGEDYELCIAVAPGSLGAGGVGVCPLTGTRLTRVGRVVPRTGDVPLAWLTTREGERVNVTESGWDHGDHAAVA